MNRTHIRAVSCAHAVALMVVSLWATSAGAYVTIWGGPEQVPGQMRGFGGLMVGDGVAVTNVSVHNQDNTQVLGYEVMRWNASPVAAEILGNLGVSNTSPAGVTIRALDMNDAGEVVGYATKYQGQVGLGKAAVRWPASGTNVIELEALGASATGEVDGAAVAINSSGVIVGNVRKYDGAGQFLADSPVRWDALGQLTELDQPGGLATVDGVNAAGAAIGRGAYTGFSGSRTVLLWPSSGTAAIPLVGPAATQRVMIGDGGAVAAMYMTVNDQGQGEGEHAIRWDVPDVAATELGLLGTNAIGQTLTANLDINAAGTVIGAAKKYDAQGAYFGLVAVRWNGSSSEAIELDHLPGEVGSSARSINDAGLAVGSVSFSDDSSVAVLWDVNGEVINLNDIIDPFSGWLLTGASEINNNGWIVGIGLFDPDGMGGQEAYSRPWLMQVTVIPEPAGLILLLIGATVVVARRRAVV
ncbi:MAG: PEP-CTERM sorting domain-containing protein [Phycisphaeraceae bacterium]|nr:PEP-CTERM sorting domain-containing protein [Phycisphaeraceae bacterium]